MNTRNAKQTGEPPTLSLPAASDSTLPRGLVCLIFALLSAAYFYAAISKARSSTLWLDEILSVSSARQSSIAAMWAAVWNGADFSPPTFAILLHFVSRALGEGHSYLVWRLPSIVAVYGAALAVYALVRKQFTPLVALLAFGLVLDSELFDFADQARQYALLSLGLATALLLWNNFSETRFPKLHGLALWLVLSACLCLHFYGVIEVAAIGVAEILWWLSRKQLRLGIWLPLILTIPVELAWRPLASHLAVYNLANDVSPVFFAKPTAASLLDTIFNVMLSGRPGALLLLAALAFIGFAYLLRRSKLHLWVHENLPVNEAPDSGLSGLEITMLSLFFLPFVTFAFSLLVTHAFATRYTIAAALIFAIAPAFMLNLLPCRRFVAGALLVLVFGTTINRAHAVNQIISLPITNALAILKTPHPPLPIVVSEAMLYIELVEAADPKTRRTLVYLTRPRGAENPDPTDENLVLSLATFHPEYQVRDPAEFLAQNPSFYVITLPGASVDTTMPSLIKAGRITGIVEEEGDAELLRASGTAGD